MLDDRFARIDPVRTVSKSIQGVITQLRDSGNQCADHRPRARENPDDGGSWLRDLSRPGF